SPVADHQGGHPPAAPSPSAAAVTQVQTPTSAGSGSIVTPIPGQVISISVAVGEKVRTGQKLLVIEAMKLENAITADRDGTVSEILVAEGDVVGQGQVLTVLT
ncbi:MAG: biotin/lipoyl-containing protein, partial [Thermodesulfobacteriota bacterium]